MIHSFADCVTAVNLSVKDQLTLSSSVAIGSTVVSNRFLYGGPVIIFCSVGSNYAWAATFALRHSRHRYHCVDNGVSVGTALRSV